MSLISSVIIIIRDPGYLRRYLFKGDDCVSVYLSLSLFRQDVSAYFVITVI